MFLTKKKNEDQDSPAKKGDGAGSIIQVFVFLNDGYLGWDCFDKNKILIGNSRDADLVIPDNNISSIQAVLLRKGDGLIISDEGQKRVLKVNEKPVTDSLLGPLDFVRLGDYTLKIKIKSLVDVIDEKQHTRDFSLSTPLDNKNLDFQNNESSRENVNSFKSKEYRIVFESKIKPGSKLEDVKKSVGAALNLPQKRLEYIFSGKKVIIKKRCDLEYAKKLCQILDKAGALSQIEEIVPGLEEDKPKKDEVTIRSSAEPQKDVRKESQKKLQYPENSFPQGFYLNTADEEDLEGEEDDCNASFSLKEILLEDKREKTQSKDRIIKIVRFRNREVLDVIHLKKGDSSKIIDDDKSYLEIKNTNNKTIIFDENLESGLKAKNQDQEISLNTGKTKPLNKILSKNKFLKAGIPDNSEIYISNDIYEYKIADTCLNQSPYIPLTGEKKSFMQKTFLSTGARYLTKAVIFHLIVLVVLSFTVTFPEPKKFREQNTHFVLLDTKNIHKPVKPKPKKIPKPKIAKAKPKKKIIKQKAKEQKVASVSRKKPVKQTNKVKPGGGHKGNLKNKKNINETGLLGALGMKTGVTIKSNKALASVTNIDAVTSTHSDEGKLKVGGLVGNLGDEGIHISSGDALNTKGSTKVLRSAGIGGDGDVAALASENTGKRDVAGGVVSAPLTKKVKFRGGGISREAVGKIINSHIDEINYCYESALVSNPSLMGKIVFEWKILLNGRVGEVQIKSSTVRSSAIHACIKSAIKKWQFPKPKGSAVVVSYPFVFDVTGF